MHKDSLPTAPFERRGWLRYHHIILLSLWVLRCWRVNRLFWTHCCTNWESVIENIDIAISFHLHQICPGSLQFQFGVLVRQLYRICFCIKFLKRYEKINSHI